MTVLAENTSNLPDLKSEHGLSLYLETQQHKILFDTGASNLFAENAAKLNIDLSQVDIAIISHGHYDHGGGIKTFLDLNKKAKIYIHRKAAGQYFAKRQNGSDAYIGLDKTLFSSNRFHFTDSVLKIDDELTLFSDVTGDRLSPSGNKDLYKEENGIRSHDDFLHEQNTIIKENGVYTLIAGCAHRGIVNIIDRCWQITKHMPDHIIGGFHLHNRSANTDEETNIIDTIGWYLSETKSQYYTGHCTGIEPYNRLKGILEDRIETISTGKEFNI